MSRPRHARRRGAHTLHAAPVTLLASGSLLMGGAAGLASAGAPPPEPALGRDVAEVRRSLDPAVSAAARADVAGTEDPQPAAGPLEEPGQAAAPPPEDTGASTSADAAGPGPAAPAPPPPAPVVDEPVAVSVPSLGLEAPLVDLGLDERGRLEVPADPDVAGWWTGGPAPGQDGPAVLAGHVDSQHGPGVFWGLAALVPGDRIVVHDADGTAVTFVVDGVGRWPKTDFPTDAVYREADGPELRLITCGGEFDRRVRSYRDNVVVFATAA